MANWISSRLKVAENFFEQIDQQAAEQLKKNERLRSNDHTLDFPTKSGSSSFSLKDQFKKKTPETSDNSDNQGKLQPDPVISSVVSRDPAAVSTRSLGDHTNGGEGQDVAGAAKASPEPRPKLTDADWVALLSSPSQSPGSSARSGWGGSTTHVSRGDDGRRRSLGSSFSVLEGKNDQRRNGGKTAGVRSSRRSDTALGGKSRSKPSDGEDSGSSVRSSSSKLNGDGQDLDGKDVAIDLAGKQNNLRDGENGQGIRYHESSKKDPVQVGIKDLPSEMTLVSEEVGGTYGLKKNLGLGYESVSSSVKGKHGSHAATGNSISDKTRKGSSSTSGDSDTDSESDSSSDSESERERERKKKILAEKAAAKALEAIRERENMVARLEGEKQSLEKILEERGKQQAREAFELQATMMETMEAAELEKQKHNNTRMEALARLAKLETTNADLAKSLATAQKNLEAEIDRVAEIRRQFDSKAAALEELKSLKISKTRQAQKHSKQLGASNGFVIERELLEAECAFLTDKIKVLEDKARKLEASIEMTRKELEDPTEVEIELNRRLAQLTDHLIHKQAQVEALSSEKAMLLFRIEAVSRLLDENKSVMNQSTMKESPDSKLRPILEDKIRSGKKHLGSVVRQLDAIFLAGAVFLRRNPQVKLWAIIYLICLHIWVIYILTSHSQTPDLGKSAAGISLESINNAAHV